MLDRIRKWLKIRICAHEYVDAFSVGIAEESSSGFTVYHEAYSLQCIRCEDICYVKSKDDVNQILSLSSEFHSTE